MEEIYNKSHLLSFYREEEKYIWGVYHDEKVIGTTNLTSFNKEDNSVDDW